MRITITNQDPKRRAMVEELHAELGGKVVSDSIKEIRPLRSLSLDLYDGKTVEVVAAPDVE